MIIFGYRGMAKLLGMVTLVCQRCGNPSAHRVVRHSRWFTLFFIPIFPISIKRSITCTFCGATTKISKEQAEQIIPTQPATQQPIGPGIEQIPQAQQQGPQGYPQQGQPQGFPQQGYPQPGYPQQQTPQPYPQQAPPQQPYPPAAPPQGPQQP